MLDLAARHALRALGDVEPNPLVGAVVVREGAGERPIVLGIGHHRRFGHAHAEREAIHAAERAGHDVAGATIYVTLEPCRHVGKQPPCTQLLIERRIGRVVYARPDPGEVSGGGAGVLLAAGIACELCALSSPATRLADAFVRRVMTGLPWVIGKWAQTLDGRVATRTGHSQWISNAASRRRVHRLRARVDGILTGIGTVIADDPMLTARDVRRCARPGWKPAARVVVDADLDLPPASKLAQTARLVPTIACCADELLTAGISAPRRDALTALGVELVGVPTQPMRPGRLDLRELLLRLGRRGITTIMTEAGPGLIGSLLEADLVNDALVFIAPMMLGDELALASAAGRVAPTLAAARRFELLHVDTPGTVRDRDVMLWYRRAE